MMKVIRWPLRASICKKFQVSLVLHRLEGVSLSQGEAQNTKILADIKWKGPKSALGSRFRRSLKTERSTEQEVAEDGSVEWNQEFENVCTLQSKDNKFQPWDVCFVIQKIVSTNQKAAAVVLGTAVKNLAEFAPASGDSQQKMKFTIVGNVEGAAETLLHITLNFVELRTTLNGSEGNHFIAAPKISCFSGSFLLEEGSIDMKRLEVMIKRNLTTDGAKVSRREKFASSEKIYSSDRKSSHELKDLMESVSLEISDADVSAKVDQRSMCNSFSYGTLAEANLYIEKGITFFVAEDDEDKISSDIMDALWEISPIGFPKLNEEASSSDSDQAPTQSSMRNLLSWRKRKLSFRSPRRKGEPLLNKSYGEEGGDEIDWDRRQAGSPLEPLAIVRRLNVETELAPDSAGLLDFGESFSVGSWERKEFLSRDGQLHLCTNVFLASIDQRSESAAGAGACTALVAVVADWMHRNPNVMPSRAEFDALIRDGSAEWRKLCDEATFKERFPDRHFDLDTVIQAGVRPLSVVPEQSFVGFFQPEGLTKSYNFLQEAMPFDGIWDEIERSGPAVYIVSWNDHFFVLKIEENRCFLIDTLGERLYEGCQQAYILKFDDETLLCHCSSNKSKSSGRASPPPEQQKPKAAATDPSLRKHGVIDQEKAVYKGRDACREFVRGFLAALPLRELQNDIKKGLIGKTSLHRMLQIEFHYTNATTFPFKCLTTFQKIESCSTLQSNSIS